MELVASLPPDLAAAVDPTVRAAAPQQHSPEEGDADAAAAAAAAPFNVLLALLTTPLPTGGGLPAGGNSLPAGSVTGVTDSVAGMTGAATVAGQALPAATGDDLLGRLKAALAADTADPGGTPPTATTVAQIQEELPLTVATTQTGATTPMIPTSAAVTAAAQQSPATAGANIAAALAAALSQGSASPAKASRPATSAATDQTVAQVSTAAAGTDLHAGQASPIGAPMPATTLVDAVAKPMYRDAEVEAVSLSAAPPPVDAQAPAPTVGHAPTQPHAVGTSAQAADAAAQTTGTPIDTHADNWHEALASRVQVLVDQHVGEARIKLSPPELGALDVKISLVEDKTYIQLTAGTSAARDELAQSLPKLRELFSASGLSLGGATVQSGFGGQAGQAGQDAAPRSAAPTYSPFAPPADEEFEPVRTVARAPGSIDVFA